ncbi:crotonase/enoyl-CoA hydratase family protein [Arundinibacter roseus]|uniref:Crotonase/enoyl-CoA hydratase family protein n=1 Tax=Arundinibacter roseus TaxID=2070510 RepID=A0A4R4KIY8_9BACT|nr:crotonase/enoyl-CoA hydratase family protein [Arundinibacter roseus]TDB67843.1 crotonase/enoyl-CoA hydratase family protein [Arundinibacter roseus]
MELTTLTLSTENHVAHLRFNRPQRANALNQTAWNELKWVFEQLDEDENVRVIVLSGEGKHFCSGIDLELLMSVATLTNSCEGRKREQLRKLILALQAPINAIEQCSKPVIAAVHGGCIGGGVDIVSACDMRFCTEDAYFTIREIDMGMVADLGTLQRLPRLIPEGIMREMAYTGRAVAGPEAARIGLVNATEIDQASLMDKVQNLAGQIARKSPLSIRGTKHILNHSREHSIADGLEYMATWNAAMLLSSDLTEAFQATIQKRQAEFEG